MVERAPVLPEGAAIDLTLQMVLRLVDDHDRVAEVLALVALLEGHVPYIEQAPRHERLGRAERTRCPVDTVSLVVASPRARPRAGPLRRAQLKARRPRWADRASYDVWVGADAMVCAIAVSEVAATGR
jgi:hypothetical protein